MKLSILIALIIYASASFCQDSLTKTFELSKGHWKIPAGAVLQKKASIGMPYFDGGMPTARLTGDTAFMVYSFAKGNVVLVADKEEEPYIIVQSGNYIVAYSGFEKPLVKKGDIITKGQRLGKTIKNYDNAYCMEIYISNREKSLRPEDWFEPIYTLEK